MTCTERNGNAAGGGGGAASVYKKFLKTQCRILKNIMHNRSYQEVERKEINVAAIKSAHLPIVWVLGKLSHLLKGQFNDTNIF
jgi:hypothetical protein